MTTRRESIIQPPRAEQDYIFAKFRAAVEELPDEITVLPKYDVDAYLSQGYRKIYVDCQCGTSNGTGEDTCPVATVERALELANTGERTAICIREGEYFVSDTVKIEKALSGAPDAPFILTSVGGKVTITTARTVSLSDFSPVEADDEIAARLPESVKSKVLFADFKKKGWSDAEIGGITRYTQQEDLGEVEKLRTPRLFVGGHALDIARHPNASGNDYDRLYFEKVYETGSVIDQNGSRLYAGWIRRVKFYVDYRDYLQGKGGEPDWEIYYTYQGKKTKLYETKEQALSDYKKLECREREGFAPFIDRHGNYNMDLGFTIELRSNLQSKADNKTTDEQIAQIAEWKSFSDRDVMIFGNAYEGWDFDRYIVRSIDKSEDGYTLTTRGGSRWGAGRSRNSPTGHNTYHIYNAIEALDTEGEWYMDRVTGRMYIYPTDEMRTQKMLYAANICDVMKIEASNVIVNGICVDRPSSRGIYAEGCEGVVIQNCSVTNTYEAGIELNETSRCAVIYNTFKYNMDFSVNVMGQSFIERGVPARNVVQNNLVDAPCDTQRGLNICGYMNCASHNTLIMSNLLISGGGRVSLENIIEYNEIPGGHTAVSDAGLIYMNQFYARGTHVRCNYLHSWKASGNGVYLDDLNSGNYIYYNIIDTTEAKNLKPKGFIYSSSGHDHIMYNNFCIGRTRIFEDGYDAQGNYRERVYTGIIASATKEKNEDGKYPFITTIDGKTYTVMTDMTDRGTSFLYVGSTELEDGMVLEVWSIKTRSDDEGDYVSLTWRYKDGSWRRCINYNDKINQSWMYFSDTSHLGYRFRGFADKFIDIYSGFAKPGAVYEKRFPELYTYMDMYKQYIADRDKTDYRINPLEIFIRSTAMNNVRNNIIVGVPRPFNRAEADSGVWGVDANGKDKLHISVNTDVYTGNFDISSDTYSNVLEYIEQYQDKSKPCPFDFRTLMKKAESEQKKQNPDYKSLEFVLDRAGLVK